MKLRRLSLVLFTAATLVGCDAPKKSQAQVAAQSPLIALTPTEFNNCVRELLGFPMDGEKWPKAPKIGIAVPMGAGGGIFGSVAPASPDWPYLFPEEARVDGFEGISGGQVSSAYLAEQIQKAARHFGAFALVSPIFFTCADFASATSQEQERCAVDSLVRFASRAWRRPLTQPEGARIELLWKTMVVLGTPEQAIALSVSALLQSPSFLFRVERGDVSREEGGVVPLSDWEMASRLSFALWDSMPDAELFAAAAAGKLRTASEIEVQARRMLKDPQALPTLQRFHHQWLGTDRLHRVSPSRRVYGPLFNVAPVPPLDTTGDGLWPAVMNPLRLSYKLETDLFIRDALFGRPGRDAETVPGGAAVGTLTALLTMRDGYASSYTGPVYGVGECDMSSATGGKKSQSNGCELHPEKVDLSPDAQVVGVGAGVSAVSTKFTLTLHPAVFDPSQRAGVLTLPSVLALGAHAVHPSPILRGKRVLERVACVEFGSPPAAAEAAAPPDAPDLTSTNRERTEASTKPLECTGCHEVLGLNMAGFAFEHYDSFGRWRAKDGDTPVNAAGVLPLSGHQPIAFDGGVDLSTKLASNARVRRCYVKHWTRYILGAQVSEGHPQLHLLEQLFLQDDNVIELLVSITKSDLFRFKRQEAL